MNRITYVQSHLYRAEELLATAEGGLHYASVGEGAKGATREQKQLRGQARRKVEQALELLHEARAILRKPETGNLPFIEETL